MSSPTKYFTHGPTDFEKQFAATLRDLCLEEMAKHPDEEMADKLDIAVVGLERLRRSAYWSIDQGLRIAQVLDLPVIDKLENLND